MTKKIICIKTTFHGIYEWGNGYKNEETARKWENFWRNAHSVYWRYVAPKDCSSAGSLVSTMGSIYLHPMGFDTVLKNIGCSTTTLVDGMKYTQYFGGVVSELMDLCRDAAEACDGTVDFQQSQLQEVTFDMSPLTSEEQIH